MTSLSVGLHFNYVIAVRIYKHKLSGFKTSRWPPEFHRLLVCMSPATLVITVCSWQTISVLFSSLRQHSNFTLNFAAIIHTQKDVSVVKKKLKSSTMSWAVRICVLLLSGRANLVWECDDNNHLTSCQTLLVFIRPYDYYVQLVYCTYWYLSLNKIRWTDFIYIGHCGVMSIKI